MEHKLDDFFQKKVEKIANELPENTSFDEGLFWNDLQKTLHKPKPKHGWKWIAAAASVTALMAWIFSVSGTSSDTPKHTVASNSTKPIMKPARLIKVIPKKLKIEKPESKKREPIESTKEIKLKLEQLALKLPPYDVQISVIRRDSISFQPLATVDTTPKFKTIHVNEISNTEKDPIPQPKFKIRFAARNPH